MSKEWLRKAEKNEREYPENRLKDLGGVALGLIRQDNIERDKMERENNIERYVHLPAPVYFVESPDDEAALIGINVKIDKKLRSVSWFDTVRERTRKVETISYGDDGVLLFTAQNGYNDNERNMEKFRMSPMTLETYNEKVKEKMGWREFDNENEMIQAFLDSIENE